MDWARGLPGDSELALVVHLDRAAGMPNEATILRDAVHDYFSQRVAATRSGRRELFRRGRISLAIGLAFLGLSIGSGDALAAYFTESRLAQILRESLVIGGWVAMWRPLGNLSLRLVAHSRRGSSFRSVERNAGTHRVRGSRLT